MYYSAIALIVLGSFLHYAPCFFAGFDSDHAIHVLMANDLSLPHDLYYWGQSRLGSLLPLLAAPVIKWFKNVHPLYVISVIQYLFLLIPTVIVSSFIKDRWLKIALFCFVFFPFNEYYILLMIGHPYSGQYLCAVLCIYFIYKFQIAKNSFDDRIDLKRAVFLLAAQLFYGLGAWVSEFNFIIILIPVLYSVRENKGKIIWILILSSFFILIPALAIKVMKSFFPADPLYEKAIFLNAKDVIQQSYNALSRIKETLFFNDGLVLRNINYYVLLALSAFTIILGKKERSLHLGLTKPILITAVIAFIIMFFSTWNLRSEIAAKYYIPVCLMILTGWLFYLDSLHLPIFKKIFAISCVLISCGSLPESKYVVKEYPGGPFKNFSDFQKLSKGTLIGHYWDVYMINAVAIKNLKALNYEDEINRNHDQAPELMRARNFYFINNAEFIARVKNDTIHQFGYTLSFTGKKVKCNGQEVRVFRKAN